MRRLLLLVFLVVLASACGKSTTAPSSGSETFTGSVAAFDTTSHTLNIRKTGVMTLTLTWSSNSIDLDLYLTDGTCNTLFSCTMLAESDAATGNRESVTWNVRSGETYKAWVDSFSGSSASYTLQYNIP